MVLLALAPVGIVAALPVITSIIAGDGGFGAGMIIYSFFGLVCLGFLGALLTSVVTVWQSSAFTMAYMEFAEKKPLAA